jgi:hypothetical protein
MEIAWQGILLWSKFGTDIRSRGFLGYSELRISRLRIAVASDRKGRDTRFDSSLTVARRNNLKHRAT